MANRVPEIAVGDFPSAHPWLGQPGRLPRTRHGLWLLTRYFVSKDAWIAWPLLLLAIGQQFGAVYVAMASNAFEKRLFDAVGDRAGGQLPMLMITFVALATVTVAVASVGELFRESLSIRWRRWLADDYTGRWLSRGQYYAIERSTLIDNPDQRMSDDINLFVDGALKLSLGIIYVSTSTVTFSVVLWRLSGSINLSGIGLPVAIPGDLVWMSILYTLAGSIALVVFGKPLVRRTMQQQHYEADFRYHLVAIRRNVEQIALARLERGEWARLITLYQSVKRNFIGLLYVRVIVMFATQLFMNLKGVLPLLIMLPRYFAGQVTMGDLMQTRGAFTSLSQSLSWFIMAYAQTIVPTVAAMNRLRMLDLMIERPLTPGIRVDDQPGPALKVEALSLRLPAGKPLAAVGDWTIEPGSRWIVRGKSGAGKSTLLRAIAGIWPDGSGQIAIPADARLLFVSQRAYLGNGSLRSVLSFPELPETFSDDRYADALHRASLGSLAERLHEADNWGETLSPGEQQRIGFARILLHRPTHLFLDEATSALDEETALAMYRLITEQPGLTIVSVSHTDALDRFHDRCLRLEDGRTSLCKVTTPQEQI